MANIAPLRQRILDHGVKLSRRGTQRCALATQQAAPRVTGALVEGIEATEPSLSGTTVLSSVIGKAEHTRWVDEGTGLFGPQHARIFPKRAKFLVFWWPVAGGVVAFRSVAGQPGQHFFHDPMPGRWHDSLRASAGLGNALG